MHTFVIPIQQHGSATAKAVHWQPIPIRMTTLLQVQPRFSPKFPFREGDAVIIKNPMSGERTGTFMRRDGADKSFVQVPGNVVSVYTYQIHKA